MQKYSLGFSPCVFSGDVFLSPVLQQSRATHPLTKESVDPTQCPFQMQTVKSFQVSNPKPVNLHM